MVHVNNSQRVCHDMHGHNVTYKKPTHSHTLARALFVQTEGNRSPRALLLPLIPKYKPAAAASLALSFARGNVGVCYVRMHYLSLFLSH
jgi:hypothetical protein